MGVDQILNSIQEAATVNEEVTQENAMSTAQNDLAQATPEQEVVETEIEAGIEIEKDENEAEKQSEDVFAKKFAALSRKEKTVRQRETEIEKRFADYEKKLADLESKNKEPEVKEAPKIPLEMRLKQDPLKALEELGISYTDLTNMTLNDGKMSVDMKMNLMREELDSKYKSEVESLKNELLDYKKEQEQNKYNKQEQDFVTELTSFINNTEEYELIRANDSVNLVYDVISQHYTNTGRILQNKEAADHVELYLLGEAKKLMKLKKLGIAQESKPVSVKQPETKTLSNALATGVSNTRTGKLLSDEESKLAAAAMIRWDD